MSTIYSTLDGSLTTACIILSRIKRLIDQNLNLAPVAPLDGSDSLRSREEVKVEDKEKSYDD